EAPRDVRPHGRPRPRGRARRPRDAGSGALARRAGRRHDTAGRARRRTSGRASRHAADAPHARQPALAVRSHRRRHARRAADGGHGAARAARRPHRARRPRGPHVEGLDPGRHGGHRCVPPARRRAERSGVAMQVFNRHVSAKGVAVFSLETVLISATILTAARVHGPLDAVPGAFWKIALATAVCDLCFYYNDLYDLTVVHSKAELLVRVMRAAGTAAVVLACVSVLLPSITMGHGVFLTAVGLLLIVVPAWRMAFDGLTQDPHLEERVLIVGTGGIARMVARQIQSQHDFAYRIVGYLAEGEGDEEVEGLNLPLLGSAIDVARLAGLHQINRVIVAISDRRGRLPIQELLRAKVSGVRIEDAATTYERITGKILTDGLTPSWFIFSDGF